MGKTRPKLNTRRTTVWLDAAQLATLKRITEQTGAPMAYLIRRGVDLVIQQHRQTGRTRR